MSICTPVNMLILRIFGYILVLGEGEWVLFDSGTLSVKTCTLDSPLDTHTAQFGAMPTNSNKDLCQSLVVLFCWKRKLCRQMF